MAAANLVEARLFIERALSNINMLHIGPLDYNVVTTVDDLMTAARLIEQYKCDWNQNQPNFTKSAHDHE